MRAWLLVLALVAPAAAQARWYQVEVIVFRHLVESASDGEQWPEMTELPDYSQSIALITDTGALADEPVDPAGATVAAVAFAVLDKQERATLALERQLRNSSAYAPLLVAAWRQPSFGISTARGVYLSDLAPVTASPRTVSSAPTLLEVDAAPAPRPVVEGTVTLKVARQMAVDVDVTFDHDGTPVRLRESRSMRLREMHYFDHPLFGVLVQVLPWDPPDADPAAGVDGDEPVDEGTAGVPAELAPAEPD